VRREELAENVQVVANGLVVESDDPGTGPMRQARPPARFDVTPSEIRRPAPLLGEHNDELLAELGFDELARSELAESGVLG
jgi:crotonobetainyl-CoA:carnitine CoA-transferase CaiB-like acyl-CoA transferase